MVFETNYRGYKIWFREPDEEWLCSDLEIKNVSFISVKRRIDEILKSGRKVNIAVLAAEREWRGSARAKISMVTVTVLCEPERERYGSDKMVTVQCWTTNGKSRAKMKINDLIPVEHRADLEAWMRLDKIAQDATKAADTAFDAIPRHDADSLMLASKEAAAVTPHKAKA